MQKPERLQKYLSSCGIGSRRYIEQLISSGLIEVNGNKAILGTKVSIGDQIKVDGKLISVNSAKKNTRLLIYNKPLGEICSKNDPSNRKTVYDNLPKLKSDRWIGIGRLDINTSGLYIFTNNGELANLFIQPNSAIEREYLVKIHGLLTKTQEKSLLNGVKIDNQKYHIESIKKQQSLKTNSWYRIVVCRGRNHEIRLLMQSQGFNCAKLMRIRYGDIILPRTLGVGKCFEMDSHDINTILSKFGIQD